MLSFQAIFLGDLSTALFASIGWHSRGSALGPTLWIQWVTCKKNNLLFFGCFLRFFCALCIALNCFGSLIESSFRFVWIILQSDFTSVRFLLHSDCQSNQNLIWLHFVPGERFINSRSSMLLNAVNLDTVMCRWFKWISGGVVGFSLKRFQTETFSDLQKVLKFRTSTNFSEWKRQCANCQVLKIRNTAIAI